MEGVTLGGESAQATLNNLSLVLCAGEILGVFSTHAAVKNDLVHLLAGRTGADAGRLYLDGEISPFEETDYHRQRRVGVIGSAQTLIDVLSVAENIFVVRKGFKAGVINRRLIELQTRNLIDDYGMRIAPDELVRNLAAADRCCLEVLKAVALGAQIVVLKDLSSFLSDVEIEVLLGFVSRVKQRGVGFLMVESSVSTLARYAERVVVLKNGRDFWTFDGSEFNEEALKECLSQRREGRYEESFWPAKATDADAESRANLPEVLRFNDVTSGVLDDLSFILRAGEELCLYDPQGAGIEEVRALLSGEYRPRSGLILAGGEPFVAHNIWQALDQRIAFVAENPAASMIFRDLSVLENLCLPTSRKARDFWLNPVYQASCRKEYEAFFSPGCLDKYPADLGARDLHKLVYCRWHLFKPDVVACIRPYSSVDKTLAEISAHFIGLLRRRGIAVLILTSSASEAESAAQKISINQKNAPLSPKNDL